MNTKKIFFVLLLLIGSIGMSVAQKVEIDFDKDVDFSKYKSATFLGWQDGIEKVISEFDQKRFRDAFKDELDKRNMERVETGGDLVFVLYLVIEQKTSTTAYTNYYGNGGGRGYRRGRGGWGGGYSSTSYSESDYNVGTLVVDVFDGESKEQIWQSIATKTVSEKSNKKDKTIPKSVKKTMKKFPIEPVK